MNALPAKLSPPEADGDIDARIREVEYRLIAREEQLRRGVTALGGQLRDTFSPRRLMVPVAGAALGLAALVALWRRPSLAPAPTVPAADARPAGVPVEIPWVRLLGLAWPMLPERWRDRVSPATASTLVTLGLPVIERLIGARRAATPLLTVEEVDLMRLSGRWFIVGELPAPLQPELTEPPELGLLPREDGEFDLLERRIGADGTQGSESRLQPVPGSHGALLRLSRWPEPLHWLSWAWSDQAVLHVDEAYDEALIGSPQRDSLWLLSRRPALAHDRRLALMQIARDRGFDVHELRFYSEP